MFGPGGPSLWELVYEGMLATDKGYDHLALKFDTTPFRTPDVLLDRVAEHLAKGPKFTSLLDLCCGTGAVLRRWVDLYDEAVGVDFSQGMLTAASAAEFPTGKKVDFVHADVMSWDPGRTFDVITSFGAFGHFEPKDQPALLALIRRSLNPGGRFVFVAGPAPTPSQSVFWVAHTFNLVMRVRNVVAPPFIMYYMTFNLDDALIRCNEAGLVPRVFPLGLAERPDLVVVEASRDNSDTEQGEG